MFFETFTQEAQRIVKFSDGRESDLTFVQAVYRALMKKAAAGDMKAIEHFMRAANQIDAENARMNKALLESCITYKLRCEEEIYRCERIGKEPPEFVPHPDQIVIEGDEVFLFGPLTRQEKKKFEAERAQTREMGEYLLTSNHSKIVELQRQLREVDTPRRRRALERKLIAAEDRAIDIEMRMKQLLAVPWE